MKQLGECVFMYLQQQDAISVFLPEVVVTAAGMSWYEQQWQSWNILYRGEGAEEFGRVAHESNRLEGHYKWKFQKYVYQTVLFI